MIPYTALMESITLHTMRRWSIKDIFSVVMRCLELTLKKSFHSPTLSSPTERWFGTRWLKSSRYWTHGRTLSRLRIIVMGDWDSGSFTIITWAPATPITWHIVRRRRSSNAVTLGRRGIRPLKNMLPCTRNSATSYRYWRIMVTQVLARDPRSGTSVRASRLLASTWLIPASCRMKAWFNIFAGVSRCKRTL